MLVGGGAGWMQGGQHRSYQDEPTMADLLVSIMDKFNLPIGQIGGSTGSLPLTS